MFFCEQENKNNQKIDVNNKTVKITKRLDVKILELSNTIHKINNVPYTKTATTKNETNNNTFCSEEFQKTKKLLKKRIKELGVDPDTSDSDEYEYEER